MTEPVYDLASFRDPAGAVFHYEERIFREIRESGRAGYEALLASGLYARLLEKKLIIPHDETTRFSASKGIYKVIEVQKLPFVSYPQEWCFSQLKAAALATLEIQGLALDSGLSLKDASAYNIQFLEGTPLLIDTLSFERYIEGAPWIAYRQFCQHFLAPLALMSFTDVRLNKLAQSFIDGIPLDLAARLLPYRARIRPGMAMHLVIHSRMQSKYADTSKVSTEAATKKQKAVMSRSALLGLIDGLTSTVKKLELRTLKTEWANYYQETNYSDGAMQSKERTVARWVEALAPKMVWDLGANDGRFSLLAAKTARNVISFDIDAAAVDTNFKRCQRDKNKAILPLILDLSNPTPAYGWANEERRSLLQRGRADLALALALIHHLAIGNNVPLEKIAVFLRKCAPLLVIEFVPKEDSQVQRLLSAREDIFSDYNNEGFERAFAKYFTIKEKEAVAESKRTLYLMEALPSAPVATK